MPGACELCHLFQVFQQSQIMVQSKGKFDISVHLNHLSHLHFTVSVAKTNADITHMDNWTYGIYCLFHADFRSHSHVQQIGSSNVIVNVYW